MSTLLEANRPRFTFQAGGQSFRIRKFQGREIISRLFIFELELVSDDPEINFDSILNQSGLLTLQQYQDYEPRYVHGLVNHFEQRNDDGNYTNYYATLVPQVWLLTQRQDCRIFQQLKVPDIIDKVLQEAGIPADFYRFDLMKSHEKREYCVQYRETDWNFLSRLLEEEGIFGYFEHTESMHTLVMPDHSYGHPPIPSPDSVNFHNQSGYAADEEHLYFFHYAERLSSGKVTLRDFNFKRPSMDLEVNQTADKEPQLEVYDYPGLYEYEGPGQDHATARLEALQAVRKLGVGESTSVRFLPGHQFTLQQHPRRELNQAYLITAVTQEGEQPQVLKEQASGEGTKYHSQVHSIPADVSYRPLRFTPKPMVEGPQTAIVVGPKGEEIYVDEHGRVKVQFHWDRLGQKDEKSSCWIRVSQAWAGQSWGGVFIPRIGQEVIVDFLEGDPDRPIITGRVYHGENAPPYYPPQNKTKSTIKSNSSPGGGGFNELRFEDLKGQEEVYLQAEKDWNILVKNDKKQQIGHNETLAVGNNRDKQVGVNQSETIGSNKTIKVGKNHSEQIGANMTLMVGQNKAETVMIASAETVGAVKALTVGAAYQVSVGAAMNTTVALSQSEQVGKVKKVLVGDEIALMCGKAILTMKKDGTIQIKGVKIDIEGCGTVTMKGVPIQLNPSKPNCSEEKCKCLAEASQEGTPFIES